MAPTDPRHQRTRERVFAAAREVFRRRGIAGASIEAIASEAGVARSTIYRNWPTRDELLIQAIEAMGGRVRPPSEDAPLERLKTAIAQLTKGLYTTEWGPTLPAIVAAIETTPEFARRYGAVTEDRRAALAAVVRECIRSGDLPPDASVDDFLDAVAGPIFYRRIIRKSPTSVAWSLRHLDRTITAFGGNRTHTTVNALPIRPRVFVDDGAVKDLV